MEIYMYIFCAVCGLVLGTVVAFINSLITRRCLGKDSMMVIMLTNFARLGMDLVTLGITFLVCKKLGLPLLVTLASVAVGLSVFGILFIKRTLDKTMKNEINADKDGGEL